jgi:hypothetical protein
MQLAHNGIEAIFIKNRNKRGFYLAVHKYELSREDNMVLSKNKLRLQNFGGRCAGKIENYQYLPAVRTRPWP